MNLKRKLTIEEKRVNRAKAFKPYLKWCNAPTIERLPTTKADFAHQFGVTLRDLSEFDRELGLLEKPEVEEAEDLELDPIAWWKSRTLELNKAIMESARKGNAQSQKLAKQLAGELVEKQEVRLGLTADERARRNTEANEELSSFRLRLGQGVDKVSS